jgi:adenylate/nucleoside-diphosphate kinase
MTDHDQQKLIEVDANLPAKAVFKVIYSYITSHILLYALTLITICIGISQAVMRKLNTFGMSRGLTTLRLQGPESEEISNDADTDDMLRSLAAAEMVAPRFRWRRSRWSRLCPVELYNGSITNGLPQYAVRCVTFAHVGFW